jgi:hypothetical protein
MNVHSEEYGRRPPVGEMNVCERCGTLRRGRVHVYRFHGIPMCPTTDVTIFKMDGTQIHHKGVKTPVQAMVWEDGLDT